MKVRRSGLGRVLRLVLSVAILSYLTLCVVMYFYQDRLLFPTDVAPPALRLPPYEGGVAIELPTDAGRAKVWLVPAEGADPDHPAPLVFYFHGNAEQADYQDTTVDAYRALGCSVLLPEYRGYGNMPGRPTQAGISADMVRLYDAVSARPDVDPRRIVFHGRSLGGGVAADLAGKRPPAALILESTFTSVVAMAGRYGVPGFLVRHPFRTDDVLAQFGGPVLVLHGTSDDIIPVSHGRRLAKLKEDVRYIEFNCGHNDFPGADNIEAYWEAIADFLGQARILGAGH